MKYRKKSLTVEAFQMTKERRSDNSEWPNWLHKAWNKKYSEKGSLRPVDYPVSNGKDALEILTLEGVYTVGWNDYIIQGIKGELYPCKPDIFEATYEPLNKELKGNYIEGVFTPIQEPLTKREQFAMAAMQGMFAGNNMTELNNYLKDRYGMSSISAEQFNAWTALLAKEQADALIEALTQS